MTSLPDDILTLMHHVIELVNLLYWVPVPTKGSKGYAFMALLESNNPERTARRSPSQPQYYAETTSDAEGWMGPPTPTTAWKLSKSSRLPDWPADLEARVAYGTALMSGHDIYYNPASGLFEDAFKLNDD